MRFYLYIAKVPKNTHIVTHVNSNLIMSQTLFADTHRSLLFTFALTSVNMLIH